jgi:hypothetical protein
MNVLKPLHVSAYDGHRQVVLGEIPTSRARISLQYVLKLPPRQPDDGHHRPKHLVVSINSH